MIAVSDKTRITEEMVDKMYASNASGGGVAWREPLGDMTIVRWEKGLTEVQMQEFCAKLPLPFVAHFRIPTCGGAIPELCHPFPIDKNCSLELSGKTKGYVLFHNGHWGDWKKVSLEAATKGKGGLPPGKWSDTRAMAWVTSVYGLGILDMIDEMSVAFGPYETELVGNRWVRVNDVIVSNRSWEFQTSNAYRRTGPRLELTDGDMCGVDHRVSNIDPRLPTKYRPKEEPKSEEKAGGTSQPVPFRDGQETLGREQDQQKQVQKDAARTGKVAASAEEGSAEDEADGSLTPAAIHRWACGFNPKRFGVGAVRNLVAEESDAVVEGNKIRHAALGIQKAITVP